MARLKVTGYLSTDDFQETELDPDSASGLTEAAYDDVMNGRYSIGDLEEATVNKED
jgi:hypothetical protein